MKRNEKRGIIISIILALMGLVGLIYGNGDGSDFHKSFNIISYTTFEYSRYKFFIFYQY